MASAAVPVVPSARVKVVSPLIDEPSGRWMACLFEVRSIEVMPSCDRVSSWCVPSLSVTITLKSANLLSPASSLPSWLVSNTSSSACMSLVAVGSQSVKTTWSCSVICPVPFGS